MGKSYKWDFFSHYIVCAHSGKSYSSDKSYKEIRERVEIREGEGGIGLGLVRREERGFWKWMVKGRRERGAES